MNLKVLPLESWMKDDEFATFKILSHLKEIKPVFNKENLYLLSNKICWFETRINNIIKAFEYDAEDFKYHLHETKCLKIRKCAIDAIKVLVKENLATKEQHKILYDYLQQTRLFKIKLSAYKTIKDL